MSADNIDDPFGNEAAGLNVQTDTSGQGEAERMQAEQDLRKLEDEIRMLRQVLQDKIRQARQLRLNLGLATPMDSLDNAATNIEKSVSQFAEDVSQTEAFKKTQAVVTDVSKTTASAFASFGGVLGQKLGSVKQSESFNKLSQGASSFGTNLLESVQNIAKPKQPSEFNDGK